MVTIKCMDCRYEVEIPRFPDPARRIRKLEESEEARDVCPECFIKRCKKHGTYRYLLSIYTPRPNGAGYKPLSWLDEQDERGW